MTLEPGWKERVEAALEEQFPSSPLNVMARRINRLAELLPKNHECDPIFGEFDALGEYVCDLEKRADLGKADWIYDDELKCHIPCCTVLTGFGWRCGNGPLEGPALEMGDCGQHG